MLKETLWAVVSKSRSSHWRCFVKKGVLKNFTKLTAKYLCWSLFFNKVAKLRPATLLKRDSNTVIFLWILAKFLTINVTRMSEVFSHSQKTLVLHIQGIYLFYRFKNYTQHLTSFYSSTFVYSRFPPKIQFLYCFLSSEAPGGGPC